MENLFPAIIVLIAIFSSIASNAKKAKQKQDEAYRRGLAKQRAEAERAQVQAEAQARPAPKAAAPTVQEARKVAEPQVHVHLEPACDVHDQVGSMNAPRTEGVDPCHEPQMPPRTIRPAQEEAEVPDLTLDWTGENMVKAFVMQEVLKRPCERRQAR